MQKEKLPYSGAYACGMVGELWRVVMGPKKLILTYFGKVVEMGSFSYVPNPNESRYQSVGHHYVGMVCRTRNKGSHHQSACGLD